MKTRTCVIALAAMAAVLLPAAGSDAGDHEYVGAAKCKMCHKVQFPSWEGTKHAKALDTAKASTDPAFDASCLKCHATNGDESLPGVQCEACHGPGGDYKKMSIMKDRDQAIAAGLIIPTQETCSGCHDGQDHHTAVVKSEQINNKEAIHEFKNPPGE